jgi:hypothetical protein
MRAAPGDAASATITVKNFSWSSVRLFASLNAERVALGTVPVFDTKTLSIRRRLVLPATVHFEVEPSTHLERGATRTESVVVSPGDRYALTIERATGQYRLVRLR